MWALTWLAVAMATGQGADGRGARTPPPAAPRVAFEVLNARHLGRSIVHLEDAVGPRSRSVGRFSPARAVLVFATAAEDCPPCATHLGDLERIHRATAGKGGMVIALMLTRDTAADTIRERFALSERPFVIAMDAYRLVHDRLRLTGPGSAVVIRSDGSMIVMSPGDTKALASRFAKVLEEEKT